MRIIFYSLLFIMFFIIFWQLFFRYQLSLMKNGFRESKLYVWRSHILHSWENYLESNRIVQNQNIFQGNIICRIKIEK